MNGLEARKFEASARDKTDLLLDSFARSFSGGLSRKVRDICGLRYFSFTAAEHGPCGRIRAGHGYALIEREALVKCVAELYERRLLTDFFWKTNSKALDFGGGSPPSQLKSFQTSNGWAVHFEGVKAAEAAALEALERHILLASYLAFGWRGFTKVDERISDGIRLVSLVTRYTCNGHRAGLVLSKSQEFPGVTFGYLCDTNERILTSPKWTHALFESLEQLLGYLEIGLDKIPDPSHAVEESVIHHLKSEWTEPVFCSRLSIEELPPISLSFRKFDLMENYNVPLMGYHASGDGLIPLFFSQTLTVEARLELEKILLQNGVPAAIPERHPVL